MSSSSSFCLACGCSAEAGNRRFKSALLCHFSPSWEEALDCKLAEKGLNKSVLLGGEGFPAVSRGYVCRKCYNLLNGYCERRKVVFHNIDQAIEVLKQGTASDTTRDSRARKRTSEAEHSEPATKSPRLADDGREQVSAHTYFLMLHCPARFSALPVHSHLLLRLSEQEGRGTVQTVTMGQQRSL